MKTKPFNLEEALNGAKVVTRDGQEVKELTHFKTVDYEVDILVGTVNGTLIQWYKDGGYNRDSISPKDLLLAFEPQSIWVNVYYLNGKLFIGSLQYKCYEDAYRNSDGNLDWQYIKTIEITDEL